MSELGSSGTPVGTPSPAQVKKNVDRGVRRDLSYTVVQLKKNGVCVDWAVWRDGELQVELPQQLRKKNYRGVRRDPSYVQYSSAKGKMEYVWIGEFGEMDNP